MFNQTTAKKLGIVYIVFLYATSKLILAIGYTDYTTLLIKILLIIKNSNSICLK